MELRGLSLDDLPLYESLRCDPRMMAELGGPLPKEALLEKLRRDIESVERGQAWIFKVIPDEDPGRAAGHICIWESSWRGDPIDEIGWMILPAYQGKGLATKAVRAVLDKARFEERWHVIHAFPSTTNAPSNALCRKMGFSKIEECDLKWAGRMLRCHHWRLDLALARPA